MIDLLEVLDILIDHSIDSDPETDQDNFFKDNGL